MKAVKICLGRSCCTRVGGQRRWWFHVRLSVQVENRGGFVRWLGEDGGKLGRLKGNWRCVVRSYDAGSKTCSRGVARGFLAGTVGGTVVSSWRVASRAPSHQRSDEQNQPEVETFPLANITRYDIQRSPSPSQKESPPPPPQQQSPNNN